MSLSLLCLCRLQLRRPRVGLSRHALDPAKIPNGPSEANQLFIGHQAQALTKFTRFIASGVSVLLTTLSYGYIMYGKMAHLVTHHGQSLSDPFFAVHTLIATAAGVLSLVGAYFLLSGWHQRNPN
jgi:hypothetical protein